MQKRAKSFTGRRPTSHRTSTRAVARRTRRTTSTATARRPQPRSKLRAQSKAAAVRTTPGRLAAKKTTDHTLIRQWVEARGGTPATVTRTSSKADPGILRIDFPGFSGQRTLKPITWEQWFDQFDERRLAFLYQEKTANGKQSRFFKLIRR